MIEMQLIMNSAPVDEPRCGVLRTVIKNIFGVRESKLRASIDAFIKDERIYAKLDNLTSLKIHSVRPIFSHSNSLSAAVYPMYVSVISVIGIIRLAKHYKSTPNIFQISVSICPLYDTGNSLRLLILPYG